MNNLNIGEYCIASYRAGESGYYSERKRGTVDVWHDSRRYIYENPKTSKRALRLSLDSAFSDFGRKCVKVTGRFPSYSIKTET